MPETRQQRLNLWLVVIVLSVISCAGGEQPPLVASDVELTEPLPGTNVSAGYLSLSNNSSSPVRISRVVSEQYRLIEIHESLLQNGVTKMRHIPELLIAPGSTVILERGGKHLMMTGVAATSDAISLKFYSGDTLLLSVDSILVRRPH